MRIASFTMIGQFPHGIDLHVRNLRWSLSSEDHIFIVTLPEYIEQFNLQNTSTTTYISFQGQLGSFINFWQDFPKIISTLDIDPEWFLFMEEDIWFTEPIQHISQHNHEIMNYLPLQKHYHSIMVNGSLFHPRVWEGANLIHNSVVKNAIANNINFSFTKKFFCQANEWQEKYGHIELSNFDNVPDTFDEFGLYCALWEQTKAIHCLQAVHLRGPESLHRHCPNLYYHANDLSSAQQKLNYLCVYAAIGVYYIAGNFMQSLPWNKMKIKYKKEYIRLLSTAHEWLSLQEYGRLQEITAAF